MNRKTVHTREQEIRKNNQFRKLNGLRRRWIADTVRWLNAHLDNPRLGWRRRPVTGRRSPDAAAKPVRAKARIEFAGA